MKILNEESKYSYLKLNNQLHQVFSRAQKIGILGKNLKIPDVIEHSEAYIPHIGISPVHIQTAHSSPPADSEALKCVDIGTGAGVPGFVLALFDSKNTTNRLWTLCDRSQKAVEFLDWAKEILDVEVEILHKGAEEMESTYDIVTARAFAPLPIVTECAGNLLKTGGKAIISAKPESIKNSWDKAKLEELGLSLKFEHELFNFAILSRDEAGDRSKIRSWKQMIKKPLW